MAYGIACMLSVALVLGHAQHRCLNPLKGSMAERGYVETSTKTFTQLELQFSDEAAMEGLCCTPSIWNVHSSKAASPRFGSQTTVTHGSRNPKVTLDSGPTRLIIPDLIHPSPAILLSCPHPCSASTLHRTALNPPDCSP